MTHKRRKNRGGRPRRTGEHGKLANNAITIRLTDDERAEWDEGAADDFETTGAWVRSLVERELDGDDPDETPPAPPIDPVRARLTQLIDDVLDDANRRELILYAETLGTRLLRSTILEKELADAD